MSELRGFGLSDDLIRRALTEEPALGAADRLADELLVIVERTPQRRGFLAWLRVPAFPALEVVPGRRRLSTLLLVVLTMLVALALAIAAIIASRPHLPAPFGLARTGTLAFTDAGRIILTDTRGIEQRDLGSATQVEWEPTWSRDGTRLAFWARNRTDEIAVERVADPSRIPTAPADLVVLDMASGQETTVASAVMVNGPPLHGGPYAFVGNAGTISWSTDGRELAFSSESAAGPRLSIAQADGSGVRSIGPDELPASNPAWSPDGVTIAFRCEGLVKDSGLYLIRADGSEPPRRLVSAGRGIRTTGIRAAVVARRLAPHVRGQCRRPACSDLGGRCGRQDAGTTGVGSVQGADVPGLVARWEQARLRRHPGACARDHRRCDGPHSQPSIACVRERRLRQWRVDPDLVAGWTAGQRPASGRAGRGQ